MRLIICIFIIFLVSFGSVNAYPVMTFEKNVNVTQIKKMVYSIPEEHFKYVTKINFVKAPIKKYAKGQQGWEIRYYSGWNDVRWRKNNHYCYYAKIDVFVDSPIKTPYEILVHELGHVYEYCVLKKSVSTEAFADSFRV